MTMQLIIGIGTQYLQQLLTAAGATPDAPTLAALMVASIILLVIAHRLPQMVAGMVVGGGHNGAIGGVGIMGLLGTGIAMTSMAGSAAAAARTAGISQAAVDANQRLLDRIAVLEEANAAGSGNGNDAIQNAIRPYTNIPDLGLRNDRNPTSPGTVASSARPTTTTSNTSRVTASPEGEQTSTAPAPTASPEAEEPDEPSLTRPMTPDEQRGFPPPTDPPEWQN